MNTLVRKHDSIFAVTGNCDEPSFVEELVNLDISVEGDLIFRDGLAFAGSGGALKFTGTTPNERTDEDLASDLEIVKKQLAENGPEELNNLILITHQPPFDSGMDKITAGISTGSKLFRQFIEEYQPLLALSGHIHESYATGKIGKTVLMNPGSLAEGRYGIVEIERSGDTWSVTKAELKTLAAK